MGSVVVDGPLQMPRHCDGYSDAGIGVEVESHIHWPFPAAEVTEHSRRSWGSEVEVVDCHATVAEEVENVALEAQSCRLADSGSRGGLVPGQMAIGLVHS